MFALIVEVEVLVLDLRYVCLLNVMLVCLFDRLFVPLLVNQIDETLISVQHNLLLEMTASGIH